MSVCLACKGVTGEPHTCEASGLAVAEEAYAAGAVELGDALPNHTVTLSFVVRGTYEHADAVAFTLAAELTARSDVAEPIAVSVKAHDPAEFEVDA